jgi:hypothetical protein
VKIISSYSFQFNEVARPGRLELPTLCLEGRRSIQLSYGRAGCLDSKSFRASNNAVLRARTFCAMGRRADTITRWHARASLEILEALGGTVGGNRDSGDQSTFARLAGGTIPFIRKYSTICP